jgi:molecular chaperone DnaK
MIFQIKKLLKTHLGQTVTEVVITVPATLNDAQRLRAIGELQVQSYASINEPTAAALAY